MLIKTQLSEKDFINASFAWQFSKTATKIYYAFISIVIIICILSFGYFRQGSPFEYIYLPVLLSLRPILLYLRARQNYRSTKSLQETIEYHFNENELLIQSPSLQSNTSWNNIYKVSALTNWVFIWHNNTTANIISKKDVWGGQLVDLKEILDNHQVKNNL